MLTVHHRNKSFLILNQKLSETWEVKSRTSYLQMKAVHSNGLAKSLDAIRVGCDFSTQHRQPRFPETSHERDIFGFLVT
jgi:hypothetical protein